jgi:sterol desaturase/sphingolipid hydroxylase (fatty acid hydroxylase superfamily)
MAEAPAELLQTALVAAYGISVGALVAEYAALRLLGERLSRRQGLASLLSGGLAFGGLALAQRAFYVGLMDALWAARLVDLGAGVAAWLLCAVLYDLMFYLAHRLGHEVRLLWCFHSVHHTSGEMRLTSAIRGSAFDFVYLPWFFLWMPLLGIHPAILLTAEGFSRIWGVLTHAHPRFVGRLGWLDRALVTPSVHRVHHGRNPDYLDRNYGELLTVWDHLLGTYTPETEPPDYGVLKPVDPGSLADIQLSPWRDLLADLRRAPDLRSRLRYLLDAPGYSHDGPDLRVRARRAAAGAGTEHP